MPNQLQRGKIDYTLIFIILLLAVISVFTLYTLDPYLKQIYPNTTYYIQQIIWYIGGSILIGIIMLVDYDKLRLVSWLFYGVGVLMLLMLYFHFPPGIAKEVNGAWGWFEFPVLGTLQPAEFMKVFLVIFLAHLMVTHNEKYPEHVLKTDLLLLAKIGLTSAIPIFFLIEQPDLGGVLVLIAITASMILVSGIKWRIILFIFGVSAGAILSVIGIYLAFPEQMGAFLQDAGLQHVQDRFQGWLSTDEYRQSGAYQLVRAMLAIGSGQLSGKGIGNFEMAFRIPEYHTDMIFTAIAEQFGFIGSSIVITIYFLLIYRLIFIAIKSKDPFGSYIITGLIGMFTFQVFQNIGMSIKLLPITGLPLPFISYGGSSTLTYMIAIGLVLNIYYRIKTYMFDES
ncbi:cell division protein FtsW (lipid II flippase) [Gracilibacillus halotolerans]|uniref:Cell division protein FtsW (Lipid II flippase) n=1 Tax=Gracilibacillus halotolerans TaxID=74386 RepID=A0A841RN38_9BACI|nr:FtsW/RodA/SpoVE family cell cycle protein [Gracilibacillus halotolerans]MBB6512585.1 cell division protein FtsW (lipid II flippase) [Gracilibacillus halotolerans]